MSGNFLTAFLITVGAGLATSVGASAVFFTTKYNLKFLAFGMAFSAGVMIYVSLVEILVKSMNSYTIYFNNDARKGYAAATATLFGGILLTYFIDVFVHYLYHLTGVSDVHDHTLPLERELVHDNAVENAVISSNGICLCMDSSKITTGEPALNAQAASNSNSTMNMDKIDSERLMGTALITAVAIGLHNFPEGLATFVALSSNLGAGVPLAFAIAIHNIPEGMAVALPVFYQSGSKWKAFWWGTITGLTEPIGALIGWVILANTQGNMYDMVYALLFGLVAGMMTYISFKELIPTAYSYHREIVPSSLFAGMFVMAVSLVLFVFSK